MLIVSAGQLLTLQSPGTPKRGKTMREVGLFSPGALAVKDGLVLEAGDRETVLSAYGKAAREILEFPGCAVIPGLVDSHTHPVFAGSRLDELTSRLMGEDYLAIQAKGGGIRKTVAATREASDEELYAKAERVLRRMIRSGATTLEAKTGYGLSPDSELRQLRILKRLQAELPAELVITFLGAHSVPPEYAQCRETYVNLLVEEMLPQAVGLAEFADVFCESGAFTLEETRKILTAAKRLGFKLKLHAEQFTSTGAAALGVELGAVSADHLEAITPRDIELLAHSDTVAGLLPLTPLFMNQETFPPARELLDRGAIVALASDYNAGSCFSEGLPGAISAACLKMKMSPEEALNAAALNAAYALDRGGSAGSLEKGKKADFLVLDTDDYREFPYHLGADLIKAVFIKGRRVEV